MIETLDPKGLMEKTKGKVDTRGATVIFNILDEIKYKLVSVADLQEANEAITAIGGKDKKDKRVIKPENKKVVGEKNNISISDFAKANPEMIRELNNTLTLIYANTKRSNREAMQVAANDVVALIKKYS